MRGQQPNQALYFGTIIAFAFAVLAVATLIAAEISGSEAGIAYGLAFMVVFYLVSLPAHGALGAGAVLRGFRVGFRPIRWTFGYLLFAAAVHLAIAAHIGAFDKIERQLADWQRGRDMPVQVAFESALARPTDIAAVRAALTAGADPDGTLPGVPVTALFSASLSGNVELVTALLEGGADPNVVNLANQRPLDVALIRGSFATALEIAQAGGVANDSSRIERVMDTESPDAAQAALREWLLVALR
jgi:hypothetical protein